MEILTTTRLDGLERLVGHWGVSGDWDVLVAGDGSGAGWRLPVGWAGVLVDRRARSRIKFYGGMNLGTIAVAELMPYVQALRWHSEWRRRLEAQGRDVPALVRVHVVTDSAALAQEGTLLASGAKPLAEVAANRADWAALLSYEREGYVLAFHWIPRATAALNVWCDAMARICFRAMKALPRPAAPDGAEISIYDCNADHDGPTPLHDLPARPPRARRRSRGGDRDCPARDAG